MKKYLMCLVLVIAVALVAKTAMAIPLLRPGGPVPPNDLQDVLDSITVAPTPLSSSVNVTTDYIADLNDNNWSITGAGGSVATIIIELAGAAPTNNFGIYDPTNIGALVQVFAGGNVAGDQAVISIKSDGSVFLNFADTGVDFAGNLLGFYLDATAIGANGGFWYSNTALNADQTDHMLAYQGTNTDTVQIHHTIAPGLWTNNEYILAWEDLTAAAMDQDPLGNPVGDYDDFVVMVESVHNVVPEPSFILLLGSLLIGLGLLDRKRYMK
jgi:hypothetical protein